MFTVVLLGRDKVQGGLLSCFLKAVLRDVFIVLSCLHSPCTETARALHSSFLPLLVWDKIWFPAQISAKGLLVVGQMGSLLLLFVTWILLMYARYKTFRQRNTTWLQDLFLLVFFFFFLSWIVWICCSLEKGDGLHSSNWPSVPGPRHPIF